MISSTLNKFIGLEEDTDYEAEFSKYFDNVDTFTNISAHIYIPSKGRSVKNYTAEILTKHGIPFTIVVEPQEVATYSLTFGTDRVLSLDQNDQGISYARSFIKAHSKSLGEEFHWQLDDDIKRFTIRKNNKNLMLLPAHCLSVIENFTFKYSNVAAACATHCAYAFTKKTHLALNRMTYLCLLVKNDNDISWRKDTNEDLDYSLQLLESGQCTIAFNSICFDTPCTTKMKGGNMLNLFVGDGRKKIYENTVKLWPNRFIVKELNNYRGWALKHIRRFYDDYKQMPILKESTE